MRSLVYDLETKNHVKYAPYTDLRVYGLLWDDGTEETFTEPFSKEEICYLQTTLGSPDIKKIGFNNCNYDDIVSYRHGIVVNEINREDGFLAAKTLWPELPAFSLKFLNWWIFGDFHWPEYELYKSTIGWKEEARFTEGPDEKLIPYNSHDLVQHRRLWDYMEPLLVGKARQAYELDKSQGKVIEQMIFKGGLHIDKVKCEKLIHVLESAVRNSQQVAKKLSGNKLQNANSGKQLGQYFTDLGYSLDLTETGEFQFDKETIEELWRLEPVAKCVKNIRKAESMLKYYRNYLSALNDPTFERTQKEGWIPTSFSIDGARTRRYTSNSRHKLNFQNPSSNAKKVQIVPPGWLGGWIDSTQVENVVHIYESKDWRRRKDYESNPEWSEYVWLCNMILGTNLGKKELDKIKSQVNELWSVYKQYKTIKLMMNFGAGARKFAQTSGFSEKEAKKLFEDIHRACPAIRSLQRKVQQEFDTRGEVYDAFGHVYRLFPDQAYKLPAYLIQGCGTGSLPKAQLRANYDTFAKYNSEAGEDVAVLCATTHDESAFRIRLDLGQVVIDQILEELMYNMTKKFEPLFDNIPLRAKLYVSTTTNENRKEVKSYAEYLKLSV